MTRLGDLGEFVRSASSTVEAPVVRRLKESLGSAGPATKTAPAKKAASSARSAAPQQPSAPVDTAAQTVDAPTVAPTSSPAQPATTTPETTTPERAAPDSARTNGHGGAAAETAATPTEVAPGSRPAVPAARQETVGREETGPGQADRYTGSPAGHRSAGWSGCPYDSCGDPWCAWSRSTTHFRSATRQQPVRRHPGHGPGRRAESSRRAANRHTDPAGLAQRARRTPPQPGDDAPGAAGSGRPWCSWSWWTRRPPKWTGRPSDP